MPQEAATVTPPLFTGEWIDADGTIWDGTREVVKQGPTPPRLMKLRIEVTEETQGKKVPGRIRMKRVLVQHRCGHGMATKRVAVYHREDARELASAPTRKDAFKESDRQQWEQRWYLSPSAIAKHVGVDVSLVYHQWMKHGILVLGGRKPTESEHHEFGRGHYGRKKV